MAPLVAGRPDRANRAIRDDFHLDFMTRADSFFLPIRNRDRADRANRGIFEFHEVYIM